MDGKHCQGCENNFYNGNNDKGINECWSLKDAVLISQKMIPVNEVPPHTGKPKLFPKCYHASGFVMMNCENGDKQYFGR